MDRDNPFKTASDILLAWTVYAAAKKAELESGADLARDAGAMAEAETPVKAQVQL
jgi:hypothetical protein